MLYARGFVGGRQPLRVVVIRTAGSSGFPAFAETAGIKVKAARLTASNKRFLHYVSPYTR